MQKIPVILVVLNRNQLQNALITLNFNTANLLGIVTETGQAATQFLSYRNMQIPLFSFSAITQILNQVEDACWLICGPLNGVSDIYKTKNFCEQAAFRKIISLILKSFRSCRKNGLATFATLKKIP